MPSMDAGGDEEVVKTGKQTARGPELANTLGPLIRTIVGDSASPMVVISGLTLTKDRAVGNSGGAISNGEDLTIDNSILSGNSAEFGGGIFNGQTKAT